MAAVRELSSVCVLPADGFFLADVCAVAKPNIKRADKIRTVGLMAVIFKIVCFKTAKPACRTRMGFGVNVTENNGHTQKRPDR